MTQPDTQSRSPSTPNHIMDFTDNPDGAANFLAGYLSKSAPDIRQALVVLTQAALGEVPFRNVAPWNESEAPGG